MKIILVMSTAAMLSSLLALATGSITSNITAEDQLYMFKQEHPKPTGILTTGYGYPVELTDTQSINTRLLLNPFLLEGLGEFDRERIPERVVHAKGAGAHGFFKVTHDLSDICKAKVFDKKGKITPVTARFSLVFQDRGGNDVARESHGFAIKFYTEEGNYDFVGLNFEMFLMKDPIAFPAFVHAFKRNPKTNLFDTNSQWDFLTLRPESLNTFMRIFGDTGIPDGYRFMPAFTIHTFELYNKAGERSYVRFHMLPDGGIRFLTTVQAMQITDPDYANRDLYNAIANGKFPTWTLHVQVIKYQDVKKAKFDIFDITKLWPVDEYPLRPVGQLVLNKNPENYFAEVEQLAFNPGNLVPGIRGVDSVFEARAFSYADTQYHRLGKNFNRIPINCPLYFQNYNRDGRPPVLDNGKDRPNYYPNSFNGPMPYLEINRPTMITVETDPRVNNLDQARNIYVHEMSLGEKCRLANNIAMSLSNVVEFVKQRALNWYKIIHVDLAKDIELNLITNQTTSNCFKL